MHLEPGNAWVCVTVHSCICGAFTHVYTCTLRCVYVWISGPALNLVDKIPEVASKVVFMTLWHRGKTKQNAMTIKTEGLEYCGSIHPVWFKLCVPAREDESDVQMHKIYSCILCVRVYGLKLMCAKKSLLIYVSSTGQRAPISAISMYACWNIPPFINSCKKNKTRKMTHTHTHTHTHSNHRQPDCAHVCVSLLLPNFEHATMS